MAEMANYEPRMRTSYFQVKDKEAFIKEIENVESIDVQIETDDKGIMMFGSDFYWGTITKLDENGVYVDEEYVSVFEIIRTHLKEGESVLVNSIRYGKMRYFQAASFIITTKGVIGISAEEAVLKMAVDQQLLTKEQANKLECTH